MKFHTKFDINYILGLITGKLTKRNIRVQLKEFPFLDTKTRWDFVGTHNGFCPKALGKLLNQELEKHEGYLQANKGKKQVVDGREFLSTYNPKVESQASRKQRLGHGRPRLRFIRYYASLRYCNVVEVSSSDYDRIKLVLDEFKEDGGIKRIVSAQAHLMELIQGRPYSLARIK